MAQGSFITILVECPHCGIKNTENVYADRLHGKKLIYCDVEIGGCDEQFAYSVDLSVETEVFKLVKAES